jgi:hypothetical protein
LIRGFPENREKQGISVPKTGNCLTENWNWYSI